MKLSRAIHRFANTQLEGWDGTKWVANIAQGSFQVYDRFISARTFGQKKRIFLCTEDSRIPAGYEVVRDPDGVTHLVESRNADIGGFRVPEVYAHTFMLHEAPHSVAVISFAPTLASSGLQGTQAETVDVVTRCDMERYTSEASGEVNPVRYSVFTVVLPSSIDISTDHELIVGGDSATGYVGGVRYEIKEVIPFLLLTELRVLQRGVKQA